VDPLQSKLLRHHPPQVRHALARAMASTPCPMPQDEWSDWTPGALKVDYRGRRPVCDALGKCLGGTGHWTRTFVAMPSLASPNLPPCLTKPDEAWRHLQSERVRALNQARHAR